MSTAWHRQHEPAAAASTCGHGSTVSMMKLNAQGAPARERTTASNSRTRNSACQTARRASPGSGPAPRPAPVVCDEPDVDPVHVPRRRREHERRELRPRRAVRERELVPRLRHVADAAVAHRVLHVHRQLRLLLRPAGRGRECEGVRRLVPGPAPARAGGQLQGATHSRRQLPLRALGRFARQLRGDSWQLPTEPCCASPQPTSGCRG